MKATRISRSCSPYSWSVDSLQSDEQLSPGGADDLEIADLEGRLGGPLSAELADLIR
jgi:hypothetical protein